MLLGYVVHRSFMEGEAGREVVDQLGKVEFGLVN